MAVGKVRFGLFLCLMLSISEGYAGMFGLGKKVEVFLCPEIRGRITLNGEPVVGAKIIREVIYDNATLDETESTDSGNFSFEKLLTQSRTPNKAFAEARTRQVLVAEYEGKRYLLWLHITDSIVEEPFISGKLQSLHCDLANEEIYHHFPIPGRPDFTYNIKSICRWH